MRQLDDAVSVSVSKRGEEVQVHLKARAVERNLDPRRGPQRSVDRANRYEVERTTWLLVLEFHPGSHHQKETYLVANDKSHSTQVYDR